VARHYASRALFIIITLKSQTSTKEHDPMNILQTPVRFASTGGVETYVRELSTALSDRGHSVSVICAGVQGSPVSCDPRIRTIALPSRFRLANTDIPLSFPARVLGEDPDVIHAHLPTPWSADWSGFAARRKNIPLVLGYYNDIAGKGMFRHVARTYNRLLLPRLLDTAGRIVILRAEPLPPALRAFREKVVVIPPGVDCERFAPREGEVDEAGDIFFLSVLDRYHGYKGLEVLLRASALVKDRYPGLRVIVGGEGEEKARYRQMARDLGLSKNVRFEGHIPGHQVAEYYRKTGIFVLPSTDPDLEGFGIVALEAMASGRPVVTTDVPGVAKDLVAEKAGIVVKRHDVQGLADALLYLLDHDDEMRRMGRHGRRVAMDRYSWATVAERFEVLYREVLDD
jgi:glycosyltransferase involved in cell wall biosynthesis